MGFLLRTEEELRDKNIKFEVTVLICAREPYQEEVYRLLVRT